MFQREVALRIVATPAERADYGRLGVLAGWRTQARILFDVPPAAFTPPPKVTSSVVELIPRSAPDPCDARTLSALTPAAFGQRRKMLRQSLKGFAAVRESRPLRPPCRSRARSDHAGGRGPGRGLRRARAGQRRDTRTLAQVRTAIGSQTPVRRRTGNLKSLGVARIARELTMFSLDSPFGLSWIILEFLVRIVTFQWVAGLEAPQKIFVASSLSY